MHQNTLPQKKSKQEQKTSDDSGKQAHLIVFNDDQNTFDWVIVCFMKICRLELQEAVEKTIYIHYNGQGIVRSGEYSLMKEMKDKLIESGLNAIVARPEMN